MKEFESVFLGLILAGVVLMIIGFGLMMAPARSIEGQRTAALVEKEKRALASIPTIRGSGTVLDR
jgi:hypothetical protein